MESPLRAAFIYIFLLIVFRLLGKRSLAEVTTFDFVLLLIIGEATQQALLGEDYSVINAAIVILTLIFMDLVISLATDRFKWLRKPLEDVPLVLLSQGKPLIDRMRMVRITMEEVMEAARASQGLESIEQIKLAVLERDGKISIIPEQRRHP